MDTKEVRREASFFSFMEEEARKLERHGKIRTGETYLAALRSFKRFRGNRDLSPVEINMDLMRDYEARLCESGVCPNTSSFYMRILRAVYNRAVTEGLTPQRYPFKPVYTGIGKTHKRALPFEWIKRVKELDLSGAPAAEVARDLFLFGFYTRGMAFVDMAYLRKSDLRDGILSYRRRKTGQRLSIRWEACMEEIVRKYVRKDSPYLLPILCGRGKDARTLYENASARVNTQLKKIGKRLGLPYALTMYVGRHTWASVARERNVPIAVISAGLGHDSETTTCIYLASIDQTAVDEANERVLVGL